ncbi:MAG: transposase [Elusimicrobiota bacterium]
MRSTPEAFLRFLECGIMRFGAVRYRCEDCREDLFVAFSCKRRGLCPSCDAKRATIAVCNATERLLPAASYRQWVLVVPKRLRFFMNLRPDLPGELSGILAREIELFIKRRSGDGDASQLHFIQRAGSTLNRHVHVHAVASDGAFLERRGALGKKSLGFRWTGGPNEDQVKRITEAIRRKVLSRFVKLKVLPEEVAREMLAWEHSGFSLHTKVKIGPQDREGLARLLDYCARPSLSEKRVSYRPKQGLVVYRAEKRKGETASLALTPVEFMRRWALLMPPPRKNLLRYYGALGPKSPLRPLLVASASKGASAARLKKKKEGIKQVVGAKLGSWAACLARVFEIDPLECRKCGKRMIPVAVIMDNDELVRLLTYLRLPTNLPKTKPATEKLIEIFEDGDRGPPDEASQVEPQAELFEGVDPGPTWSQPRASISRRDMGRKRLRRAGAGCMGGAPLYHLPVVRGGMHPHYSL